MPRIALPEGVSVHCAIDDYLWPWNDKMPVLMMHGFARNALFWNRWVPTIAEMHRIYRPDLLGCGLSDQPPREYQYTPNTIAAQILGVLDALSLSRVHWVGESSGGLIGLLLAAVHPERVASLVLCNTPSRIPDRIRRIYALDYKRDRWQRDAGLRIDFLLLNKRAAERLVDAGVDRFARGEDGASDHAPVWATLRWI